MDANLEATVAYLRALHTPADLHKLALKIAPTLGGGAPNGPGTDHWDQFNILRNDVTLVLGAGVSGGQCLVCGAAVQTGPAATIHAAWHNRVDRRRS